MKHKGKLDKLLREVLAGIVTADQVISVILVAEYLDHIDEDGRDDLLRKAKAFREVDESLSEVEKKLKDPSHPFELDAYIGHFDGMVKILHSEFGSEYAQIVEERIADISASER